MELLPRLFFWLPLRKLLGLSADKVDSRPVQSRTLLFQLVESEVCVADALLDLNDIQGCDRHLSVALSQSQELRGPESLLMHQRIGLLREKRAGYFGPNDGSN
jgi:hypothetical protein